MCRFGELYETTFWPIALMFIQTRSSGISVAGNHSESEPASINPFMPTVLRVYTSAFETTVWIFTLSNQQVSWPACVCLVQTTCERSFGMLVFSYWK